MFSTKHICLYLTILLSIFDGNEGIYRSQIQSSANGFQFEPVNYPGQILSTYIIDANKLLKFCSMLCSQNILCRIFDVNAVVSNRCRLFQGDINIHGNITSSSSNNAKV